MELSIALINEARRLSADRASLTELADCRQAAQRLPRPCGGDPWRQVHWWSGVLLRIRQGSRPLAGKGGRAPRPV